MRNHSATTSANGDSFRRLEVITGVGRRRRWSLEEKARIVAESLDPTTTSSAVARRYGLHASQLFVWRQQLQRSAAGTGRATSRSSCRCCWRKTVPPRLGVDRRRSWTHPSLAIKYCKGSKILEAHGSRSAPIGTHPPSEIVLFVNGLAENRCGSRFGADPHPSSSRPASSALAQRSLNVMPVPLSGWLCRWRNARRCAF